MRMKTDDLELVKAAQLGDRIAFSSLLERHYDRMYRIAYRMLGNAVEAEDIVQDVCLALPQKLQHFRAEAAFTTWLHRVVINAGRDRLRKAGTYDRATQGWVEMEIMRRAETAEAQEGQDWLACALEQLPHSLRETVVLVIGEEQTHAAAAEALEISEGTVSWRMSEVKKTLTDIAKQEGMIE
jgi:RNA polymerase sigma-70 factor (ECF subfamily)